MEFNKEEFLASLKGMSEKRGFNKAVNTREFELEITEIAKKVEIADCQNLVVDLEELIRTKQTKFAFSLFFVIYTKFRRNRFGNLLAFTEKYIDEFYDYKITEFLLIMAQMNENFEEKNYLKYMRKTDRLIHAVGDDYDFRNHNGIQNCYVELVCLYFEAQLDDRYDEDLQPYLENAKNVITYLIDKGDEGKVYPKYYLNKGRVLNLLGRYKEANKFINMAIRNVPAGPEREKTIRDYEQYLQKGNLIKSYDMTTEKIKELNNVKTDNTKALALMTSLLGFLLGSINIFAQVSDVFTLGMLMLCYLGLLLILTGVVFVGLNLASKGRRKKFAVYDFVILAIGVAIFVTTICIVLNH